MIYYYILLLLFLYYSFGVQKTNMFIRSHGSLENHTRFKTTMVKIYDSIFCKAAAFSFAVLCLSLTSKSIPIFRPKRLKHHTVLFGAVHTYMPPPPPPTRFHYLNNRSRKKPSHASIHRAKKPGVKC